MKHTLGEIARLVNGELVGDPDVVVTGISGIKEAQEGDITFLANSKYLCLLSHTKASAIITAKDVDNSVSKPVIKTDNPSLAFSKIVGLVAEDKARHPKGLHETAVISKSAKLGKNVAVGAFTIIEDNVTIEDNTVIYGGCYIGAGAKIGENCLVYPHVSIREDIQIGSRVIVHCGTVIGSDGFGFAAVEGMQEKIPQIGTVVVEDDVEIGANVTIDRARFDKTIIGKGTKIDNLVQIAHNVVVGPNCIIVAQAGISGSTVVGKNVIVAGQAGIVGHVTLGDGSIIAAQAGVTKSVAAGDKVSGYPARSHTAATRVNACVQKLPELYKKIKCLEEKIEELQEKLKEKNG